MIRRSVSSRDRWFLLGGPAALLLALGAGCSSSSADAVSDAGKVSDSGKKDATKVDASGSSDDSDPTAGDDAAPEEASEPTTDAETAGDAEPSGDASLLAEGGTSASGVCGGSTPHGCFTPLPDNPVGCPPQINEQSAYYPPVAEWKGCGSVAPYADCKYQTATQKADCVCDTGLHWLCTYP